MCSFIYVKVLTQWKHMKPPYHNTRLSLVGLGDKFGMATFRSFSPNKNMVNFINDNLTFITKYHFAPKCQMVKTHLGPEWYIPVWIDGLMYFDMTERAMFYHGQSFFFVFWLLTYMYVLHRTFLISLLFCDPSWLNSNWRKEIYSRLLLSKLIKSRNVTFIKIIISY